MYKYPDTNDTNTNITVNSNYPYKNYWEKSEKYALKIVSKFLSKKTIKNTLDIGAGEGRLVKFLSSHSKNITLLEPDGTRYKKCVNESKKFNNVRVVNKTLENYKCQNNYYDLVFTSHVYQHINTNAAKQLVNKSYKILKPGGIFVLLTSHSQLPHTKYLKVTNNKNKVKEFQITKQKYNKLITNNKQVTPLALYSINALHRELQDFKILKTHVFHIMHKPNFVDKFMFRDRFYNLPWLKSKHGRDILIIAKKL